MKQDEARRARRRALRAAQVVTLGLAIAGCSQSHGVYGMNPADGGMDGTVDFDGGSDSGPDVIAMDAGSDAPAVDSAMPDAAVHDAGIADAAMDAFCMHPGWRPFPDSGSVPCCDEVVTLPDGTMEIRRGINRWGCEAWGPYLPPGDAVPPARSEQWVRRV